MDESSLAQNPSSKPSSSSSSHVLVDSELLVDDDDNEDDKATILRRRKALGLTATIETNSIVQQQQASPSFHSNNNSSPTILRVPDPYTESCLDDDDDRPTAPSLSSSPSLLQLAKLVFTKLSKTNNQQQQQHSTSHMKWNPTPIQLQSWPILTYSTSSTSNTNDLNLIAIAATGSGKTLSYALPMIDSCNSCSCPSTLPNDGTITTKTKSSHHRRHRGYVHGLVLLPTRELALQVSKVLRVVAKSANYSNQQQSLSSSSSGRQQQQQQPNQQKIIALAIYGGVDREEQIDSLSQNNSVFVIAATPFRLMDILGIGITDGDCNSIPNERMQRLFQSTLRYLIIDEADQMATKVDMSQQVQALVQFLRSTRTTSSTNTRQKFALFSATMPRNVFTKYHEWIPLPRATIKMNTLTTTVGNNNSIPTKTNHHGGSGGCLDWSAIPAHITQTVYVCDNDNETKMEKLKSTIQKIRNGETNNEGGNRRQQQQRQKGLLIVFFGRIKTLQYVHGLLQKKQRGVKGCVVVAIHSQMKQKQRETQLNLFRSGKCPILLATDIVARGIHIKNVQYIINYDFPESIQQYVHRCGRAGRIKINGRRTTSTEDHHHHTKKNETITSTNNATVYSFFHKELAPIMAKDMVELLRLCNAWVDPNLVALVVVPDGGDGDAELNRKRRTMRDTMNQTDEVKTLDSTAAASTKRKKKKQIHP